MLVDPSLQCGGPRFGLAISQGSHYREDVVIVHGAANSDEVRNDLRSLWND